MEEEVRDMHLRAGEAYGHAATCRSKVDYKSENAAIKSANKMSAAYSRKLEAYPCFFCGGWHVGRAMTSDECAKWMEP